MNANREKIILIVLVILIVIFLIVVFTRFEDINESAELIAFENPNRNINGNRRYQWEKKDIYPSLIWIDKDIICNSDMIFESLSGDIIFKGDGKYLYSCEGDINNIPNRHMLNGIVGETYTIWDDNMLTKQDPYNSDSIVEIGISDLIDTDGEITIGLDGRIYCIKVFDDVIFANYGPSSLYEISKEDGSAILLRTLDEFTGKYPAAMCTGPDGLLYLVVVNLQVIGGIGYSDWPSNVFSIDPITFEVIDLGIISGNFGWPERDMIIYDGYIYVSGYNVPSYSSVIGRFPVTRPGMYEEIIAYPGGYGIPKIYGLSIVNDVIIAALDDTMFELDPITGNPIGPVTTFSRSGLKIFGMTSIESIASIGAYKITVNEFDSKFFPSTYTTEEAVNIINNDPKVDFKYMFLPAGASFTIESLPNSENKHQLTLNSPYIHVNK